MSLNLTRYVGAPPRGSQVSSALAPRYDADSENPDRSKKRGIDLYGSDIRQGTADMHVRVIALLALLATSGALHGQYPSKPISLVVPFGAGSDADLAGRNLSEHAAK